MTQLQVVLQAALQPMQTVLTTLQTDMTTLRTDMTTLRTDMTTLTTTLQTDVAFLTQHMYVGPTGPACHAGAHSQTEYGP